MKKRPRTINLDADIERHLQEDAKKARLSVSAYLNRLLAEQKWTRKP